MITLRRRTISEYFDGIVKHYREELARREQNFQYRLDPAAWVRHKTGMEIWYKQQEMFDSVVKNKNTAVRAGHGTSKSTTAAMLTLWWIDTREVGEAFVGTTAPSFDQVTGVIWREIRRFHMMSQKRAREFSDPSMAIPGTITQRNEWKIEAGGTTHLVAQGRKPPDNKAEDAFQGFHAADGVLAIGDEACGLSEGQIDGLANITTNATSRILLIGNPTDPASHFAKIFRDYGGPDGTYNLIHISVLDSPNFHGGGLCDCHSGLPRGLNMPLKMLEALSDETYVEAKKKEYGEDSPRYKARVLGQFASDGESNLFSDFDLAQARNTQVMPDPEDPYRVFGVDVARMGQDSTVIYLAERGWVMSVDPDTGEATGAIAHDEDGTPIRGIKLTKVAAWRGKPFVSRTEEDGTVTQGTTEALYELARQYAVQEVRVDASGMGHGVIDPLAAMYKREFTIVEVMGGGASPDRRSYFNNRAFQYSELRRMCFQGMIDIDPTDEQLLDELSGITYFFANQGGGLQIESKESMKKRGVKSPDYADAAWYAFHDLSPLFNNQYSGLHAGDMISVDFDRMLDESPMAGWHAYSW